MTKIHVLIPNINRFDLLNRQLEVLDEKSRDVNFIIFDNGSDPIPGEMSPINRVYKTKKNPMKVIDNKRNIGCLPVLRTMMKMYKYYGIGEDDLLIFMHNDVLIWQNNWDDRVREEFYKTPDLGLAGLFGAPGVAPDGGRMFPRSNMIGAEWGTDGTLHGHIFTEVAPAAVLDSLCMMFRFSALLDLGIPENWAPHHWFDRSFCTYFIDNGYKVAIIGIPFDHYGGGSSGPVMDEFCKKIVKDETGEEMDAEAANHYLYMKGLQHWNEEYAHRLPLISDADWNYYWKGDS